MMTAQQIRATLKPMADFAPAILRAAEIVEMTESAEAALQPLRDERTRLVADNAALKQQNEELQRQLFAMQAQITSAAGDLAKKKQAEDLALAGARQARQDEEQRLTEVRQKLIDLKASLT